jgi:imidazolonepropionase-like amidohydrolase
VIDGDTIVDVGSDVPAGAKTIDCSGLTITAGFWNSHVHFFERMWAGAKSIPAAELQRQLDEFLTRYGFVSVFDLSSDRRNTRAVRDRIEAGEVSGPRIRTTGRDCYRLAAPHPSCRIGSWDSHRRRFSSRRTRAPRRTS